MCYTALCPGNPLPNYICSQHSAILEAMLFTSMTSSLAAAVVVVRTLFEDDIASRESFDIWLYQWEKRTSSPMSAYSGFLITDISQAERKTGKLMR
jgi:hypothetical protein